MQVPELTYLPYIDTNTLKSTIIHMLKNLKIGSYEVILLLLTFATFTHTLYFDFFIFDDHYHLAEDPNIYNVTSWQNFLAVWKKSTMPVMYNFWQMMIFFIGKESATHLRFVLILQHAINGVLVFKILQHIISHDKTVASDNRLKIASFVGASFFLFHPTQVESILWISSMKGVFSTLFALVALLIFILKRTYKKNDFYSTLLTTIFYVLSLLTKPSSVPLPIILILLDKLVFGLTIKESFKSNKFLFILIIPFGIFFFFRSDPNSIIYVTTFWQRLIIFFHSNIFYLNKIVFPFTHTLDYGNNILNILREYLTLTDKVVLFVSFLASLAAAFGLSFIILKNKFRFLPLAIFLILINLFTGLIPFDFQNVSTTADRYMYFPLLGVALFMSFAFYHLKSKIIKSALLAYLCLFFVTTLIFSNLWKDQADVLMSSYEKNPNSYMLNIGLGELFLIRDELKKAKVFLQKATFISPNQLGPHQKLLEIHALSLEHQQGLNYINFLKKKYKKLPLTLSIYEIDYLIGLERFDEAKTLIDKFQEKARNHDLILDRIEKLEFKMGTSKKSQEVR